MADDKKKEIIRTNESGLLEGVCPDTGDVLWTEKAKSKRTPGYYKGRGGPGPGRPARLDQNTHHYVHDGNGKKLWVPKGTNPDLLPRGIFPYSQVTCDNVCHLVMQGYSLIDIGLMEGFPPAHILHKWSRKYPEFRADLKKAREARAEHYADKAIKIAETTAKKTVNQDRLKFDIYKWGAMVGDPDQFGSKTKISGDPDAPIGFVIDTGIRRSGDPGALPEEEVKAEIEAPNEEAHDPAE